MIDLRGVVDRILKGKDHGTEVCLSGPDVAALPLQLNRRGAWPVIPTQQEHFEHTAVIRLDRREHRDFDHRFCAGKPDTCE